MIFTAPINYAWGLGVTVLQLFGKPMYEIWQTLYFNQILPFSSLVILHQHNNIIYIVPINYVWGLGVILVQLFG